MARKKSANNNAGSKHNADIRVESGDVGVDSSSGDVGVDSSSGEDENTDTVSDNEDTIDTSESSEDEFEQQSSTDSEANYGEDSDSEADGLLDTEEQQTRSWKEAAASAVGAKRSKLLDHGRASGALRIEEHLHVDDLSSDDEDIEGANTIGRVPLHWYDAYDHVGYDVKGNKLLKRKGGDRIDQLLANRDDPASKRTVYDMYNDREVVLSERELEIIRRVQAGAFAHPEFDDTPDYNDYYTSQKEVMPLSAAPEPKRRFVPSKWEMMRVMKIVQAVKEGRYKEGPKENDDTKQPPVYLIWNDEEDEVLAESRRNKFHLPAPRMPLPGHAESYRPPQEYLLTKEEEQKMLEMDPSDRPYNFIPKSHSCLRHVAGYNNFVKERFERCLDLYLCPRKLKRRLNIDPETLVPRLPSPKDLKPFPNTLCLQYLGHKSGVRSISISPDGQYLASGSEDGSVRLWEIDTCLCRYEWIIGTSPVASLKWNPDANHALLVATSGKSVVLIATGTGDKDAVELTKTQLSTVCDIAARNSKMNRNESSTSHDSDNESDSDNELRESGQTKKSSADFCKWELPSSERGVSGKKSAVTVGPSVQLTFKNTVGHVAWHYKGDYLAVVTESSGADAVSIHQLSKGKTQTPFTSSPGNVQTVSFHPSRPFLFVATQQYVKVYHLIEQKLVKKLLSGCKWLSSMDVHSSGDHVILGSYDRRVVWFDLDLSSTPYKTLKFHEKAVRCVTMHRRYPLMASASDDGNVHIFHCMVYSDLARNPLLVPLKVLRGHGVIGGAGVFSIAFHPTQPWIFSAGADGVVNLYQDL